MDEVPGKMCQVSLILKNSFSCSPVGIQENSCVVLFGVFYDSTLSVTRNKKDILVMKNIRSLSTSQVEHTGQ